MSRDPVVEARHYAARLALQPPPRRRGRALRVTLVLIILLLLAPGLAIWLLDPWDMFEHRSGWAIDIAARPSGTTPAVPPVASGDRTETPATRGRPDELEAKVGTLTKEVQDLGARTEASRAELDRLAQEEAKRRAALDELDRRLAARGDATVPGSGREIPSAEPPPQPFPFPMPKPAGIPPAAR